MPESGRYDRLYKALQIARNTALAPVGARYLPWGRSMTVKSDDWDDRDAYTVADKAVEVAVEC